jgi:hypothetical protein
MSSVKEEVMSVRDVFVDKRDVSKSSASAPKLLASDELSSPIIGTIVDNVESLFNRPSAEPGVVDQSTSSQYEAEFFPSIFIGCLG